MPLHKLVAARKSLLLELPDMMSHAAMISGLEWNLKVTAKDMDLRNILRDHNFGKLRVGPLADLLWKPWGPAVCLATLCFSA